MLICQVSVIIAHFGSFSEVHANELFGASERTGQTMTMELSDSNMSPLTPNQTSHVVDIHAL